MDAASSTSTKKSSKARMCAATTLSTEDCNNPQWSIETLNSVLVALPQTSGAWTSLQLKTMKHTVIGIQQMITALEQTLQAHLHSKWRYRNSLQNFAQTIKL